MFSKAMAFGAIALSALSTSASAPARLREAEVRGAFASNNPSTLQEENVKYDGRFVMARIKYTPEQRMSEFGDGRPNDVKWDHDYPRSERHFMKIIEATTLTAPRTDASNIFTADDPELMKFPFAYMCEVGFWQPSDKEVLGLRTWLLKGGFLIVDDFRGQDYVNFYQQMKRVLPDAQLIELDVSLPVFHSFFEIPVLNIEPPYGRRFRPQWFGIFEDNDRKKRLMMAISYNNDISEYWEWSDTGTESIVATNDAYEVGVNYAVYAMTH